MAEITENQTSPPAVRTSSPSPSTSPTPAIFACPPLERSVSTASSASNFSARSATSRSDTNSSRRRGYVRPQPTLFADSARSRESVMSLGSIAHLQHYFARTGLLDGKGAQMMSGKRKNLRISSNVSSEEGSSDLFLSPTTISDRDSTYSSMRSSPEVMPYDQHMYAIGGMVESPIDERGEGSDFDDNSDSIMLPPTVSTYQHREKYVAPPPELDELRRDLRECLVQASNVLREAEEAARNEQQGKAAAEALALAQDDEASVVSGPTSSTTSSPSSSQGWYELQGTHILDVVTLAIRAAKLYYTAHDQPARLSAIKSERKIRAELLGVLEVLRKMATRKFSGGMRVEERETMQRWTKGIEDMLVQEAELEKKDVQEREGWQWMQGDWTGRERERELAFLQSFDADPETLPPWTAMEDGATEPTAFLREMQNGLRLVLLHNELVRKSKRPFGYISEYHTDTMKPYRCADNLRYWIKEAELRWEVKLKLDVMAVVYGQEADVWRDFDAQILRWCGSVREEITDHIQSRPNSEVLQTDRGRISQ
ncbi:MAG: hypothetical protein M1814_005458 [Vezdaea aestivalis]|nr:MAG: hypothetical protein M1814_005458 [Vezdaea aestivalis]